MACRLRHSLQHCRAAKSSPIRPLANETDLITRRAVVFSALMSLAAASSDYWHRSLHGPALCVLDTDGNVVCRVSSRTDGAPSMQAADASIILAQDQASAYRAVMSNGQGAESFCYAAAQAARWNLLPLAQVAPDGYHYVITLHEAALHASMTQWDLANDLGSIRTLLLTHAGLHRV